MSKKATARGAYTRAKVWQCTADGGRRDEASISTWLPGERGVRIVARAYVLPAWRTPKRGSKTTVIVNLNKKLYEVVVSVNATGKIGVGRPTPIVELTVRTIKDAITTGQLEKLLCRVGACLAGRDFVISFSSVHEAWEACDNVNWLLFLWTAIAAWDTDDIFLNELAKWIGEHPRRLPFMDAEQYKMRVKRMANVGNFFGWQDMITDPPAREDQRRLADEFRQVFRAPTIKEVLRLEKRLAKWHQG